MKQSKRTVPSKIRKIEDSDSSDDNNNMPGLMPREIKQTVVRSQRVKRKRFIGIWTMRIKFQNSKGITEMSSANKSN